MSQRHHVRTGSQGRKVLPPHARPQKPAPMRRGASYNNSTTHAPAATHSHHNSITKPGVSRKLEESFPQDEDEECGMASFLQFCATCEKQIVTPGSSILYCSEACRKKDVSRPPSIPSIHATSPSPMFSSVSYFDHTQPNIMPQRSPTVLRPTSLTLSDLSMSDFGSSADGDDHNDRAGRKNSDASRYLDQFYSDFASAAANNGRRPRATRNSTATDSSNIPSLCHSPSSSYGTVASNASYNRSLVPRHNPFTTTNHRKSLELVAPYNDAKDCSMKSSASTLTSYRVAEAGDISYEKRGKHSNKSDYPADNDPKQQSSIRGSSKASPKSPRTH